MGACMQHRCPSKAVCVTIRHRTHRSAGAGFALKKLEPSDVIVFPLRYRRDGAHRRDLTGGGAKNREGNIIL